MLDLIRESFYEGEGVNFPVSKPQMDEGWLLKLSSGAVCVNYENEEFSLVVERGEPIYFWVADGLLFSVISGSEDLSLRVIAIKHECLSMVYPQLGSEANAMVAYSHLVTSSQMDEAVREMVGFSFDQLLVVCRSQTMLLKSEELIVCQMTNLMYLFHNGISRWLERQDANAMNLESRTQPYRLMNMLAEIFNQPESFRHRDVQYFAERLNISVRYFYEVCVKETGVAPKTFIDDVILSEMKHVLLTTTYSLQEICDKFGFHDQSGFSQYFKRGAGMTPSEFRKSRKFGVNN